MTSDVRESIAANIDARAASFERIAGTTNMPLGYWFTHMQIGQWLRTLADEVRAGVL